jgi:hypothetical protein
MHQHLNLNLGDLHPAPPGPSGLQSPPQTQQQRPGPSQVPPPTCTQRSPNLPPPPPPIPPPAGHIPNPPENPAPGIPAPAGIANLAPAPAGIANPAPAPAGIANPALKQPPAVPDARVVGQQAAELNALQARLAQLEAGMGAAPPPAAIPPRLHSSPIKTQLTGRGQRP